MGLEEGPPIWGGGRPSGLTHRDEVLGCSRGSESPPMGDKEMWVQSFTPTKETIRINTGLGVTNLVPSPQLAIGPLSLRTPYR